MESAALGPGLIGRQVQIMAWADYGELFRHFSRYEPIPPEPVGTITGMDDYRAGHQEIRLQIAGLPRPFVFDADELELLS